MNRLKFLFASFAACVALAACTKKDFNAITGTSDFTSVALSSDPATFDLHVRLEPQTITVDSSTTPFTVDTVPAHYVPADSVAFDPIATLEPQGVAVANGQDNMSYTFGDSKVASINESFYVQGDTVGTTTLTVTYTDVDHNFTTTPLVLPVTVTVEAP
jgi:hypothetical protein